MLSYHGHIVNEYFRCFTLSCGDVHCAFPMRFAFSCFLFALSTCPRHAPSSSYLRADISLRCRGEPACRAQSFRRRPWVCSSAFLGRSGASCAVVAPCFCVSFSRLGLPFRLCGTVFSTWSRTAPLRCARIGFLLDFASPACYYHNGNSCSHFPTPLACRPIVSYRLPPALSSLFHVFFMGDPQ